MPSSSFSKTIHRDTRKKKTNVKWYILITDSLYNRIMNRKVEDTKWRSLYLVSFETSVALPQTLILFSVSSRSLNKKEATLAFRKNI